MASFYTQMMGTDAAPATPRRRTERGETMLADIQHKIIAEARRQGVDPALALGISQAESSFNPQATGDRGQAVGLFQLHPAAAQDVGLRPDERFDLDKNIRGGIAYLKNRLKREGQEDPGISAYNQGVGMRGGQLSNPQYVRTVRQYQQQMQPLVARAQPGLLARVGRALSPASAEAAPMSPARASTEGRVGSVYEQMMGRSAPAASAPPPSPSTPPPAEIAPPPAAGAPAPGAVAPPASGVGSVYGQMAPPPPPQQSMLGRALQYGNEQILQPALQYGLESLTGPIPAEYYTPKAPPPLLEQAGAMAIPTMTTATGAALGAPFGPIGAAAGAAGGSYAGRRANVALGLEQEGLGGDLLSLVPGLPAVWAGGKSLIGRLARGSRAGRAVTAADEATAAGQQQYQQQVQAGQEKYQQQVQAGQEKYQQQVQTAAQQAADQRAKAITAEQTRESQYQQRVERQSQAAEARHATATQEAATTTQRQAQEYAEQVQRYEQSVQSQRQAVQKAGAIPRQYAPDTPAHVLYKKVSDIAPEAPVTLTRMQDVAAELQDVTSQIPSLQPSRLQTLLTDVRAGRSTQSVKEVQRYLSDLGTLTRSGDSATRRTAKQLYAALHDDLAESAGRLPETEAARDLLLQANSSFRREMATRDLGRTIRQAVTVGDDGIPRFAPGRALTRFDRLVEEDTFFAGSFTPDELTQMRANLEGLTTAQKIPARPGAAPAPVTVPPLQTPAAPVRPRAPYTSWKPTAEVSPPQAPPLPEVQPPPQAAVPTLPPQGAIAKAVRRIIAPASGATAALIAGPHPAQLVTLAPVVSDLVSELMVRQDGQRFIRMLMRSDGTINPQAIIALAGGRAALQAEQKQREQGR